MKCRAEGIVGNFSMDLGRCELEVGHEGQHQNSRTIQQLNRVDLSLYDRREETTWFWSGPNRPLPRTA